MDRPYGPRPFRARSSAAEHLTFYQRVDGSIPSGLAKELMKFPGVLALAMLSEKRQCCPWATVKTAIWLTIVVPLGLVDSIGHEEFSCNKKLVRALWHQPYCFL